MKICSRRRQVLHRRVAEILRDSFADTAAAEPEALAPRAAAQRGGGRRRPHRRRAAVRRGSDAAFVGARRGRRRHRGDSGDAAAIADGAVGPAWPGARGSANRLGDRPAASPTRSFATWRESRLQPCKLRWRSSPKPTLSAPSRWRRSIAARYKGMVAELSATANSLLELTRQHGIPVYATLGTMCSGWARAQLGDREAGVAEFREALATYTGQGNKGHVPLHQGLLAELEADGPEIWKQP